MNLRSRVLSLVSLGLIVVVASAACGNSSASLSPTSPSSIGSTTAAVIQGRVNGGSGLAQITGQSTGTLTVTVAGTTISSSVDSLGQFTLTGVPAGDVKLQFSGPGINATVTITVNAQDQIQIAVTLNGNSATIESNSHISASNAAELEGRITEIDAVARTMRVAGALVNVPASATIKRESMTLQFADLKIGDIVHVRGNVEGTMVQATEVKVQGASGEAVIEMKGTISELAGTCPSLTFSIGTVKVVTSGSTYFKEGSCAALMNGASVEVKGRRQADGSIAAIQVKVRSSGETELELEGAVSGLTGTCPALSFTVQSVAVKTDGATHFEDPCAQLQDGRKVEVKGSRQTDGSVLARKVELDDDHDDDDN